jgi:hypothetical protein
MRGLTASFITDLVGGFHARPQSYNAHRGYAVAILTGGAKSRPLTL